MVMPFEEQQARRNYRHVRCADGAVVSVQAGAGMYSLPRGNAGPYTHVEAGFPTVEPPPSWRAYAEDPQRLQDTVYPWLPYALVDEFVALHGGQVDGELPPRAAELESSHVVRT